MQFNLYGYNIQFSDEQIICGRVWAECLKDIKYYYDILDKRYVGAKSLSYAISDMPALGKIVRDKIISREIELLHKLEIYDISPDMLYQATLPYLGNLEESLYQIKDKYLELRGYEKEAKIYRDARKEARSKLVGGGFGLGGAIKGMMMAETVNATTGVLHSVFNMVDGIFTGAAVEKEIDRLYRKPSTKKNMQIGLREDIKGYVYGFLDILGIGLIYNEETIRRAFAIYDNIANGIIKESNTLVQCIVEMISLCPFIDLIYDLAYFQLGDSDGELIEISNLFGVEISIKEELDTEIKKVSNAKDFFGEIYMQIEEEYKYISAYTNCKDKFKGASLGKIADLLRAELPSSLQGRVRDISTAEGRICFLKVINMYGAQMGEKEKPLIVFDSSVTMNAKNSFILTNEKLYTREVELRLEEICSFKIKQIRSKNMVQINEKDIVSIGVEREAWYLVQWLKLFVQVIKIYNTNQQEKEKQNFSEEQARRKEKSKRKALKREKSLASPQYQKALAARIEQAEITRLRERFTKSCFFLMEGKKYQEKLKEEVNKRKKYIESELVEKNAGRVEEQGECQLQELVINKEYIDVKNENSKQCKEEVSNISANKNISMENLECRNNVTSTGNKEDLYDNKLLPYKSNGIDRMAKEMESPVGISGINMDIAKKCKTETNKKFSCIPGFRTNKRWKKAIGIISYIILGIIFIGIFKIQYPETYSVARVVRYRMTVVLMYVLFLVTPFLILTDTFDLKEKNKFCKKHPFLFRPIFLLGELVISFIILIIMAMIS